MIRRHLTFDVEGSACLCTLDDASGTAGLLIVSGGNELRSGPAGVQAALAARIATRGFPVFRYDRRGVGDSEGGNCGFRSAGPDLAAALAAFRAAAPHLERVVAYGNCDAASLLMLEGGGSVDALALGNPWTFEDQAPHEVAPHVVRAHYRQRLTSGSSLKRVLRGEIGPRKIIAALRDLLRPAPPPSGLASAMREGLANFRGEAWLLIAGRDRTGQQFRGGWAKSDPRLLVCQSATHAFVEPESLDWLEGELLKLLEHGV